MKNIILIGFMAVGKTTIGKYLKKMLKYNFIDTDHTIEINEGNKILEIFKKKGEKYFRLLEKNLVKEIVKKKYQIISTGGGLFIDSCNQKLLLKEDFVIFLNLSIKEIYKRIKRNKKRPLVRNISFEKLVDELNNRKKEYQKAHIKIDCDKKNLELIAKEINFEYNNWLKRGKNDKKTNIKKNN